MAAIDSYKNDPACKAVRRMVDAGIVVVVAAGNNGKDSNGTSATAGFTRRQRALGHPGRRFQHLRNRFAGRR